MLRRCWHQWKAIAHTIGTFQSRILLNVFYLLILIPFGVGVKLFSDPLRLNLQNRSHWLPKAPHGTPWDHARRQF
jgi:hypothetical protein